MENKGWINKQDPCGCFQWYFRYWLRRRSKDDERQIKRWNGIVNRFKGKLIKMIKKATTMFIIFLDLSMVEQIFLSAQENEV